MTVRRSERLAAPPGRHQQGVRNQLRRHAALIAQPTTRRENRSMTADADSQPSAVQMQVKSAIHFWFGCSAANCRSRRLNGTVAIWRSPSSFGRRARKACTRTSRSIRCRPDSTPLPKVSPDAPCAVGPVAGKGACLHLPADRFVASGSGRGKPALVGAELLHPFAQHVFMKITGGLRRRHPALPDNLDRLDLSPSASSRQLLERSRVAYLEREPIGLPHCSAAT